MKAIVVERPGGPEVLQITELPVPEPKSGWVLIRVKAFGLNRSEMFTRQGHSPSVQFPRVLGIECVGVVEAAPDTNFSLGQTVVAMMGGLGRAYNGGYAEYTLVPARQVIPLQTVLPWEVLGAIPETYITAWGSLVEAMEIKASQTILIRGGTSALGMAATNLAKEAGLTVIATTRNSARRDILLQNGVDEVVIDSGAIAKEFRQKYPEGVDGVLELVGTVTLMDSLHLVRPRGIVCYTGILGNAWAIPNFEPFSIPSTVRLTAYTSETVNAANAIAPLQAIVDGIAARRYKVNIDKVFRFDEIVAAHRYMEDNRATGKLVVLTD